ncbi:hypothetical protein Goshw_025129 [Gossypium schwendimanii]|uniref:Uncharacterized protein n=1 Tax=Gossypium schwendimanii TaxID=34291 RepID=A0A7J9MKC7_GOSSC|nr:hypothetical protein [Gossypium schwendimanii]
MSYQRVLGMKVQSKAQGESLRAKELCAPLLQQEYSDKYLLTPHQSSQMSNTMENGSEYGPSTVTSAKEATRQTSKGKVGGSKRSNTSQSRTKGRKHGSGGRAQARNPNQAPSSPQDPA